MKSDVVLDNGTILKKGRWYKYTVVSEGLYTNRIWRNYLCKVENISNDWVRISEPFQGKEYTHTINNINKYCIFKPWWKFWINI